MSRRLKVRPQRPTKCNWCGGDYMPGQAWIDHKVMCWEAKGSSLVEPCPFCLAPVLNREWHEHAMGCLESWFVYSERV